MHTVYLALGSNVGDRIVMLNRAVNLLEQYLSSMVCSPIYETKPWGFEEQENFLNIVIKAETVLSPQDLLKAVKDIEEKIGRQRTFLNGPREIDIDILFYDDLILKKSDLVIPHPHMAERDFVLKPLIDINPDFIDPETKKTIKELYEALPEDQKTIVFFWSI